jgi:hypothetical protein
MNDKDSTRKVVSDFDALAAKARSDLTVGEAFEKARRFLGSMRTR